MPLKKGYSQKTMHENIGEMVKDGYSPKQAVAASMREARHSYFRSHPQGHLPPYLKLPNGRRDRAAWEKLGKI